MKTDQNKPYDCKLNGFILEFTCHDLAELKNTNQFNMTLRWTTGVFCCRIYCHRFHSTIALQFSVNMNPSVYRLCVLPLHMLKGFDIISYTTVSTGSFCTPPRYFPSALLPNQLKMVCDMRPLSNRRLLPGSQFPPPPIVKGWVIYTKCWELSWVHYI